MMKLVRHIQGAAFALALLISSTGFAQQSHEIEEFETLEISGPFDVIMKKGTEHELTMEGEDDDLQNVTIRQSGKTLLIKRKDDQRWRRGNSEKITLRITFVQIEEIRLSGASELRSVSPIKTNVFELVLSGASQIELEIEANRLDANVQGASVARLSGQAGYHWVRMQGASTYKAVDLKAKTVEISCQGASSAQVWADEEVKADASGASSIRYHGNPDRVDSDASGASSIKRAG